MNDHLYSIEAEVYIIEKIIVNYENYWFKISGQLNSDCFFKFEHKVIFEIIELLTFKKEIVNKISILEELKKEEKSNVINYLDNLNLNEVFEDDNNLDLCINLLKDKKKIRDLIRICKSTLNKIIQKKYKSTDHLLNSIIEKINSVNNFGNENESSYKIKNLEKIIESINKMVTQKTRGILTGFKKLDELTSGLNKSDLIIIAGRPSSGKTSFAINIAENILRKEKIPVMIFSIEMSSEQVLIKLISSISRINFLDLKNGMANFGEWEDLTYVMSEFNDIELFIDDTPNLNPYEIENKIKKFSASIKKKIGLIIIDYIQLMKMPGKYENRSRELAEISRYLKILAKEMNVPIIVLSQLNRSIEYRNDKNPIMSDIRESGAIEQDADLIIFLYKDNMEQNHENIDVKVVLAKQRNGPTGDFYLNLNAKICKFYD